MKIVELVPWLVRSSGSYWGEFLFLEIRTDEGVTGWGEVTTTTPVANRATAEILRRVNDLLVGENPAAIERLWHTTFRAISELKKIATLAEAFQIPVSPHDASGPVNLMAGAQVMATVPNFYRLESSSYDLRGYNELLRQPLASAGGELHLTDAPGLGIDFDLDRLRADVLDGIGG
jgi:L-alanine-DL-glutamate epimerase-like enolase superfamily enzyme